MTKKTFLPILFMIILICTSCNQRDLPLDETIEIVNDKNSSSSEKDTRIDIEIDEISVPIYKFMLYNKLFVDTGEIEHGLKCGTMDRGFEKIIPLDETPDENGEANFDSEYKGAQFGRRENRMVSYVDGEWHIFAYNENTYGGISMNIVEASDTKFTLEIVNHARKEFTYGENYVVEYYDKESDQWLPAEEICEYAAFHDIGYILKAASSTKVEIDFEWLYGRLEPGKYRVVKYFIDSREPGDYDKYWYMSEFTIETVPN